MTCVAVIGGGVTGLVTGCLLRDRDVDVTLYEAGAAEGGLAGTHESQGFRFDYGPHEFTTRNQALLDFLQDICSSELLTVEKHIAQHFRGRFVRYPFEVVDVLQNIGVGLSARAFLEVASRRLRRFFGPPAAANFADWTRERFGPTLFDAYFGPYTQKVWGVDPAQLDVSTASQRITVDSVWDLLKKTLSYQWLGAEDFKKVHSEYRRSFHYVRGGIGMLLQHLRRRFVEQGGRFATGKRLESVSCTGREATALHFADGATVTDFTHVVSTIPLPHLITGLFGDRGRALVRENPLPFRGMVFVFLRLRQESMSPYHWIYFPDRDVVFQRTTEFVHFSDGMAPPGSTAVAVEVSANPGDESWRMSDAAIADSVIAQLAERELVRPDAVLGCDVVRATHAYPIQVIGFDATTRRLLDAVDEVNNVLTIGRQGLFRYCNMNECMEMAFDVVPRILAGESSIRYQRAPVWEGVGVTDRYE